MRLLVKRFQLESELRLNWFAVYLYFGKIIVKHGSLSQGFHVIMLRQKTFRSAVLTDGQKFFHILLRFKYSVLSNFPQMGRGIDWIEIKELLA